MQYTQEQLAGIHPGYTGPTPAEPTTLGKATELLNHLSTLELHVASMRSALFGEASSNDNPPRSMPSTISGLLSEASTRAACLCGELSTINGKLGCTSTQPYGKA